MPWTHVNLHNGSVVQLYRQQFAQECGPSCVATLGRMFGRGMDIGPARTTIGAVDHNRPPGGGMGHNWQQDWSYMTSLTQALSQYGFRMAHTRKNLSLNIYRQFCEERHLRSPAILRVEWPNGTGHFIVAVGKNRAQQQNFIEILDPEYGYQRVSLTDFPNYRVRDPATRVVIAQGTLDRFWSVETM